METDESIASIRAELIEACENLSEQIETQRFVRRSLGGRAGADVAIAALQRRLDECEAALAGLDNAKDNHPE